MDGIHIALKAEEITHIWGLPITNTLITSWVIIGLLIFIGFLVKKNISMVPGKLQNLFEMAFEYLLNYMEGVLEDSKLARKFFPLIATIFIFIFAANMLHFLPIMGSLGFYHGEEFIPLFRAVNTDLNATLALAIIAFLTVEITGIVKLGFLKYGSKFVNFKGGVTGFLVGLVEIIGNLARLISLSFRLFGNVFAGEVLLVVIASFIPVFVPLPFMLFEVFVGFLQAAIFALLTLAFIRIAITEPHGAH